ncbi:MAG: hypothetical protein RBS76_00150 [Acholeplasmatales bacterium]|jgi:threonine/homoserine/homoserine lactone efflux protein|nr:hypothetical protein [Acholeplasmataceae bacterium]MDY0114892.1 hypothetical protein [Acholeplasmatales bacterium]MCK9233952.1 hypothetical protein [Acholeplasmataceae bacterium]MCK9289263.1 hypothetical protein [Acholeplasmataceae bacterium]MCK9427167.1 hypothetical protein [Acholeplasmataceae bacterium]
MKFGYGWLLKFILAAILVGVGVSMVFADKIVFLVTGIAITVFSLFRIYPLIKTLKKEVLRTINLLEILLDTIIGVLLIYIVVTNKLEDGNVWYSLYRYFLAFFFYLRGAIFFTSTTFFDEKTEVVKFIAHFLAIVLASYFIFNKDFDPKTVAYFFLVISLIGALYLSFDGYKGYTHYRKLQKELNEGKPKVKKERKRKEIEADKETILDEKKEEEQPYVN